MSLPTSLLWVALGSALGGIARYGCVTAVELRLGSGFPWGTLAVNLLGSAAIGLLAAATVAGSRWDIGDGMRQFLMIGVLGGFTTFSAFSLQTLALLRDGAWLPAAGYVLGSVVLCLAGVAAGYAAGGWLVGR